MCECDYGESGLSEREADDLAIEKYREGRVDAIREIRDMIASRGGDPPALDFRDALVADLDAMLPTAEG